MLLCFCLLRCNLPRKACDWCSNAAPPFFFLISTSGFFFFSCIDQTEPRVAHRSVGPVLYGLSLYVCCLVLHVFHSREENVKYKTPQAENGKYNYNIYILFFFCFFMQCEEVFFFLFEAASIAANETSPSFPPLSATIELVKEKPGAGSVLYGCVLFVFSKGFTFSPFSFLPLRCNSLFFFTLPFFEFSYILFFLKGRVLSFLRFYVFFFKPRFFMFHLFFFVCVCLVCYSYLCLCEIAKCVSLFPFSFVLLFFIYLFIII